MRTGTAPNLEQLAQSDPIDPSALPPRMELRRPH
jgi:hypothetical protein